MKFLTTSTLIRTNSTVRSWISASTRQSINT